MINFELIDESGIIGADLGGTIVQAIYDDTQAFRDVMLEFLVIATPIDTGALKNDMKGEFNTNRSDTTLIFLTSGVENQLAEWGRVYVLYNEGPTNGLGLSSENTGLGWGLSGTINTNANQNGNPDTYRNMFFDTAKDHLDYVTEWGVEALEYGVGVIVTGGSLRL